MAVAGQEALDPRQEKAREEFRQMREQLQQTLERATGPVMWRDQPVMDPSRPTRSSTRQRFTLSYRGTWLEAASIGVASFVGGVIATLLAIGLSSGAGPSDAVARGAVASVDTVARAVAAPAAPPSLDAAPEPAPPAAAAAVAAVEPAEPEPPVLAAVPPPPPPAAEAPAHADVLPRSEPAPAKEAHAPAMRLAEPSTELRSIQTLLSELGYEPGPADGAPGEKTAFAASKFATEYGLADSNLDRALLAALKAVASGRLTRPDPQRDLVRDRVEIIRAIQSDLAGLGYQIGKADGDAGPVTVSAAKDIGRLHELADANLDRAFLALVREDLAER